MLLVALLSLPTGHSLLPGRRRESGVLERGEREERRRGWSVWQVGEGEGEGILLSGGDYIQNARNMRWSHDDVSYTWRHLIRPAEKRGHKCDGDDCRDVDLGGVVYLREGIG
jgi:hypothetical protein